ncbi:hypothetical protein C8R47DRAFT_1084762 [Mycena vitilis]|nr:hypothetical protein C8R47DRAFT_1084762 [Mycena vitilis]
MDSFYSKTDAAEALEAVACSRRDTLKARKSSHTMHLADANRMQLDEITVKETIQGRRSWRLCLKFPEEDDVLDEVVMRVQGVITKNNLVPKNVQACTPAKAQFLSQQVEICGLDTAIFEEAMAKIIALHDLFGEYLTGVEVKPIADGPFSTNNAFGASNRVFSLKSDIPTEQDNRFQDGVDPLGRLEKLKSPDLIHAPDNIVQYFKKSKVQREGQSVYEEFIPGSFKVGDIVEMQFCLVAMSSAKSTVKITTRLQALTLLDDSFAKKAATERVDAAIKKAIPTAVRRKTGYFQEDEDEARKIKKRRGSSADGED